MSTYCANYWFRAGDSSTQIVFQSRLRSPWSGVKHHRPKSVTCKIKVNKIPKIS